MQQKIQTMALAGCAIALASLSANAAEIKVLSSNALKTTLEQLAPDFEKQTGHKLVFTWNAGAPLKLLIEKGATFDAAVLTTVAIDDLVKQGKLDGAGRAVLAYSTVGIAVRKGAPKPDISTVEAFKRAVRRPPPGWSTGSRSAARGPRGSRRAVGCANRHKRPPPWHSPS